MAVVGYADSTGKSTRNRDLSERRAQAVIYYIVTKYRTPMHRFVQPFGYGEMEATADNTTATGRAKNRRVEIRLMVNKGIAGQSASGQ
jgi:outer membrane protein OmpA-like peptidoglycan-associated protein